jgi:hypothetical protein
MYQCTATARSGLFFETWEEAERLWARLSFPGTLALCMLPDRVELIADESCAKPLARALLLHTRSLDRPQVSSDVCSRALTQLRPGLLALYAAPCRRALVHDPLAWTWSSYREALGLVPGGRADIDPEDLHHDTCRTAGLHTTPAPQGLSFPSIEQVRDAVSAATRTPIGRMHRPGAHRALWICASRALTQTSEAERMVATGAGPLAMLQATAEPAALRQIAALVGDPRFPGLGSGKGPWLGARRAA